MKRQILFGKNRSTRLIILALTVTTLLSISTYTPLAATAWKVASVELPGVSGMSNNVAFAFNRYVLIAPYASSKPVEDNNDISQLDNCFLYLIDTKKPSEEPKRVKLATNDSPNSHGKVIYYPSRVSFDADSSTVFVRGTRFEERDGELQGIEALGYLRLNLDDNEKPIFDSTLVVIDIKGVGSENSSDAPVDFALAHNGSLLLFTNGASIFSYNIGKGYVYQVDIVPPKDYSENSRISYLDIDKATDTLIVCWNKAGNADGDTGKASSELSFYGVDSDGTLPFIRRTYSYNFVAGTALTAGSTVAITPTSSKDDPDKLIADCAYFVTNDGSLCQIDFDGQANVKQLRKFDELASQDSADASPRIVKYDAARRVIGIVKQGFTAQIRRPSNGRPGRNKGIVRALNLYSPVEQPAFALVKLGKKNKVVSSQVFVDGFKDEIGLSNFVYGDDSQWLVSTRSGKLFSLGLSNDPAEMQLQKLAEIGSRIDYIEYFGIRGSVIAINSFESDEKGVSITSPGSLVVAKKGDPVSQGQALGAMFLQTLDSSRSLLAAAIPSIRRPCNVRR